MTLIVQVPMCAAVVGVAVSWLVDAFCVTKAGSDVGTQVEVNGQVPLFSKHFLISGVVVLETAF